MNINPGELDKRINIYEKTTAIDDDGFQSEQTKLIHSCWGRYTRKTGLSMDEAGSEVNHASIRFLIRYTAKTLHTSMFVLYKGKRYDILDINDFDDAHEYIEIYCEEGCR